MQCKHLLIEVEKKIGLIKINRPDVRNALDESTIKELEKALSFLEKNDEVKVVIITGTGKKSFAAGADIQALKDRTFIEMLKPGMSGLYTEIEKFEKPTIAAINGYALGGGCELAMACDIRIASENAKLGLPELNFAIIPGAGGTQRLERLVGIGKAKELIFTGDILTAEESLNIGLVNKVVPLNDLMLEANDMALKMTRKGPLALQLAKVVINYGSDANLETGIMLEKLAQSLLYTTEDKEEGTTAFLEKRKAEFKRK